MGDAAGDLVEALLEIGRNGEHVAGVAQRHLLAQIDAELVIVGRVERRDAADALRSEARAGPIGGAGIERNADHRGVVFADVAHVLHIGRLEERVDAGEMRQLAAREGRDGPVGQAFGAGQAHVERPFLLLAPAVLGELAFGVGRLPALRRQPVEVGMMAADALRRRPKPGLGRMSHGMAEGHEAAPLGCLAPSMKGCTGGITAAIRCILPEVTPRRDVISSAIICSLRAGPCTRITSMV